MSGGITVRCIIGKEFIDRRQSMNVILVLVGYALLVWWIAFKGSEDDED